MIRSSRRGKTTVIAMAGVALAIGGVAYQAATQSSTGSEAGLVAASTRPDGARPVSSPVPANLTPPAGLRRIGTFTVVSGTQTYTCANGSFVGASVPEAQLAGPAGRIHHFGGPSWQSTSDKSLVTATKTAESPVAGSIAQLLLTVNSHSGTTRGLLSRVQNIQRLNPSGGAAPTTACTDGEKIAVPYRANYVFWAN